MLAAKNPYLFGSGVTASCGALLHLLIPIGGPEWYAFFGAPRGMVQMACNGDLHAPISCVLIATLLIFFAIYAFSGAGLLRRLPLLRSVLVCIGGILILRGLVFIPLILWRANALVNICGDCRNINIFVGLRCRYAQTLARTRHTGALRSFWSADRQIIRGNQWLAILTVKSITPSASAGCAPRYLARTTASFPPRAWLSASRQRVQVTAIFC